ncbi:hypothetical protein EAO68_35320 [Streptomyces sp. wa22]|nr:hypothetical protein EAO68_35320 [Streptomyces sp. wa22]
MVAALRVVRGTGAEQEVAFIPAPLPRNRSDLRGSRCARVLGGRSAVTGKNMSGHSAQGRRSEQGPK